MSRRSRTLLRTEGPPDSGLVTVRSLGRGGAEFPCPVQASRALQGSELSIAQAGPVLLLVVGALARHVPAADGALLSARAVPTTRERLQAVSTVRGERLSKALDGLCGAGLLDLEQGAAGLGLRVTAEACAPHPLLAAVPWDQVATRVGSGEGGGTAALALLAELVLLAEALGELGAQLPPALLAGRRFAGAGAPELRVTPDFQAIAGRTRYSRTRLAQATRVLHEAGVVVWDGARGVRGTVAIAPWVVGRAPAAEAITTGHDPHTGKGTPQRSEASAPSLTEPRQPGAAAAPGRRVWIGDTPLVVAAGTPIDLTARTPDGRPGVRVVVNGVEIVVDVGDG